MVKIDVNGTEIVSANTHDNLLSLLQEQGLIDQADCAGSRACGKCKVKFVSHPPEPSAKSIKHLSREQIASGVRLACDTRPDNSSIIIERPSAVRIESSYLQPAITAPKTVEYRYVDLSIVSEDNSCIYSAITEALGIRCDGHLFYKLDKLFRTYGFDRLKKLGFYLGMVDGVAVSVSVKKTPPVFLVMDIGTTTLAVSAIAADSGKLIGQQAVLNKQAAFGADVISRISSSNQGRLSQLCRALRQSCVNAMTKLVAEIDATNIAGLTVSGNATMIHFLLGLSPENIGQIPFTGISLEHHTLAFRQVFLSDLMDCPVNVLPGFSAYVGGDIVAGIYLLDMHTRENEINMLIDLGTNGEIVLGNSRKMLATSTACGPAFEGGHLDCGMPSLGGAITHIEQDETGNFSFTTVANMTAKGICGSAGLDMLALLLNSGKVDDSGLLKEKYQPSVAITDEVFFSQSDIRELQLAISAVRTAIDLLVEEYGCGFSGITHVYLSGGFGNNVRLQSLIDVGILPEAFASKICLSGNSSLGGAVKYALSRDGEQQLAKIKSVMGLFHLARHPRFNHLYTENMFFSPRNLEKLQSGNY